MDRRALLVALALAGIGVMLLSLYVRRFEQEMSGGERIELLMAIRPIARGAVITEEMLATRAVPIAYVEDRAVKAPERPKVLGLQAAVALHAQQTLMWTDLALHTEERDLSSLVQPGKRAVTVRATAGDDTRGNALIRPGDYVDVIATMFDESGASKEQSAVVLLQRILVLAVGLDTQSFASASDPKARSNAVTRDKVLTLSLNLQEAQLLALANNKGRLSVAVRHPDDQSVIDDFPDMKPSALFDMRSRAEVQRSNRTTVHSGQPVKIESNRR